MTFIGDFSFDINCSVSNFKDLAVLLKIDKISFF